MKKWFNHFLNKHTKTALDYQTHPFVAPIESEAVEQVLNRLRRAGYQAYLVGGAVRDWLLGITPKDFDVATNATPQEICHLFRRSRIIGRRFPIVHVMIGAELIEVTTFRSGGHIHQNESGRIMRDNHYGTIDQDAIRRDFTCNALYYDDQNQHIIDYHNGIADIQARKLVMIGEPLSRFQEDPVRILRAVRLAGKLSFSLDEHIVQDMKQCAPLLSKEPTSRLFDELLKILFSGSALDCLKQLQLLGDSVQHIHPLLDAMSKAASPAPQHLLHQTLQQTDQRLKAGQSVSVGFILAALFWHEIDKRWQAAQVNRSVSEAMNIAIAQMSDCLKNQWGITNRHAAAMREIWLLQAQFFFLQGKRPHRLIKQPRFRAAYDLLLLRAADDESLNQLAKWWKNFQLADHETRAQMTLPSASTAKKKPRRRRKKHPTTRSTAIKKLPE